MFRHAGGRRRRGGASCCAADGDDAGGVDLVGADAVAGGGRQAGRAGRWPGGGDAGTRQAACVPANSDVTWHRSCAGSASGTEWL